MSYRFKQYWLRTNTGCGSVDFRPTDKEATSRAAKAFEASLLSRMFEVSEVSSPRHRWSVFGRDGRICRVCESAGPVGWRGAPRSSWGQRTPREDLVEGGVMLHPSGPHYGGQSNGSRVLHPRQSEERQWPPAVGHRRLRQRHRDRTRLRSGWEALYFIWLNSYLTSLVVIWQ